MSYYLPTFHNQKKKKVLTKKRGCVNLMTRFLSESVDAESMAQQLLIAIFWVQTESSFHHGR